MIVVAKIKAKSGEEDKMEKAFLDIMRSQKDPTVFLFYEKYADKDALKHHGSTPYFQELFGVLAPLLDGNPEIEMYDEIKGINK